MGYNNAIGVTVPEDAWQAVGDSDSDPRHRLLATLRVNGTMMHLEAFEVYEDDGLQTAHEDNDDLDAIALGVHADGGFYTTTIRGREYVLVASPYCN